jgi:hypothetical protein
MQSDESEKRRMDATEKNLFKNLTKRSEETLGAGAISEEDTSDKYVQEEEDFCESLIDPTSRTSRSGYAPDSMFQDEDDKRRKDAEDHQTKMYDLSARLTKYKLTSAGASSMPGLTLRPDPNRTQHEASAQSGTQFTGQQPPLFPNPLPPMQPIPPPQQQQQAAAGYQMGTPPMANYQGIPKLKVKIFDGKPDEYQRFKLTFNAAYDDNRHLPQKHLALLLESNLKGRPLTLISEYMRTCIDDLSYTRMWQLLDERFGGKNVEDAFTVNLFKNALPIKNGSLREVERLYDVFAIQHAYYLRNDPDSLDMERSLLFQFAKEKLNSEFSMKFIRFTDRYNCVPNFTALTHFMKTEFLFAQTREREYSHSSHKSDIKSVKKFVNFDLDEDAKALSEVSDLEDQQERFANQDDECSEIRKYEEKQKTGQKNQTRGFQNGKPNPNSFRNYGNGNQASEMKTFGFKKDASQFKEGQCSCCRQAHLIPDCPKFVNLSFPQQSTIIRRDKLCYHCLEGPHFTRSCKKNEGKLCGIDGCVLYHHRVLHKKP